MPGWNNFVTAPKHACFPAKLKPQTIYFPPRPNARLKKGISIFLIFKLSLHQFISSFSLCNLHSSAEMDISEQDRADRKKDFLSFFDLYVYSPPSLYILYMYICIWFFFLYLTFLSIDQELKETLMEEIRTMIHHKRHRLIINFAHIFHHRVQKGPDGYDLSRRYLSFTNFPFQFRRILQNLSKCTRKYIFSLFVICTVNF